MYEALKSEIEDLIRMKLDKSFGRMEDRVWVRLLQNKRFARLCRKAAAGDDACKNATAFAVWGASAYLQHQGKPSWQERYEELLSFVSVHVKLQYGVKRGFLTEEGNRIQVVGETFDMAWHLPWMFTPDVDLEAIRLKWNAYRPQEAFSNVAAMKQRCSRALESIPDSYYKDLLSYVICPDAKTRVAAKNSRNRLAEQRLTLGVIEMIRELAEMHGCGRSDWTFIASRYNESEKTNLSARQLCNRYYKLSARAKTERWDELLDQVGNLGFTEWVVGNCRNQKDFERFIREWRERMKQPGDQCNILSAFAEQAAQDNSRATQ